MAISLEDPLSDIYLFADDAVIGKSGQNKKEIKNKLQPCGNSIHIIMVSPKSNGS